MKFTETNFDNKKDDYLKYWKVVRRWAQLKHGLSQAELEMLLFLRSEKYFSRSDYNSYESLMSWDKKRFLNLKKEGWISEYRATNESTRQAIYQLTHKTYRLLNNIYAKLSGEEFYEKEKIDSNFEYTDKKYKQYIRELNKDARKERQQRLSPK
jgi:predicted DNA-binding protein YlxM (UPF0122 family)